MSTTEKREVQRHSFEVLLDQKTIAERVRELGQRISNDYEGKNPLLLGVLKGCIVFMADLMRHIRIACEVDFVTAASYRKGTTRDEHIQFGGLPGTDLKDRHVLVIEGIVETGRTAGMIMDKARQMEPASVELVTLLDKPGAHRDSITIKYKGFTIGNEFVIGYGMDNAQRYRNLPFIGRMVER